MIGIMFAEERADDGRVGLGKGWGSERRAVRDWMSKHYQSPLSHFCRVGFANLVLFIIYRGYLASE